MFDFSIKVENMQVFCDVTTLSCWEICLTFIIQTSGLNIFHTMDPFESLVKPMDPFSEICI